MKKELYIFSGLGADERVFQRLNFSAYNATFIKWINPRKNESIEDYATRLIEQITSDRPVLIGLSFGGIMANEVAKQIYTEKVILLATVKIQNELPLYYRIVGYLRLHRLLPTKLLKHSNWFSNWLFGVETDFERQLLKQIQIDTDSKFLEWAIDKIVRWTNESVPRNCVHIHGTSDRILPMKFVSCDISVPGGGHFMTLNKSEELNKILHQLI